jgi:hypothetical protein
LKLTKCDLVFEMQLIEYNNPLNKTYSNKLCSSNNLTCNTGFLFCLVDLPFRNPQNCSLGDLTTSILGGNAIQFRANKTHNFTYEFLIKHLPPEGISQKFILKFITYFN